MRFGLLLIALFSTCVTANADDSSAAASADTPEMRIAFAKNPALPGSQCNPLVKYELRSEMSQLSIQTTFEIDGQSHVRNIILKATDGILTAQKPISGFSPEEASCDQIDVTLIDIKCGDPSTFLLSACSMPVSIEGETMFSTFETRL